MFWDSERFYGDKCVNYCALKETIAKTCKPIQETRDLEDFVEKNVDNGAKCCLDSFSGRRRRGCLNFPSLGSPHGGKCDKNTLWKNPGRPGLRMARDFLTIFGCLSLRGY